MRQVVLGLAALAVVGLATSTVLAAGPVHGVTSHASVMTVGYGGYSGHGSGYSSRYGHGYSSRYGHGYSSRYGHGYGHSYRSHGGPIIIRPPVYRHPPVVVPFPGHPPVVHPPMYNRYRYYRSPHNRMYFGGRGFGISIGF